MRLVEIVKLNSGGHRNLTGNFKEIPEGYAVIPEGMTTENFPFGEVTAEEIYGVMTVTKWVPGVMPEPEPMPDPEPTADELMDILLGGAE